MKIGLLDIDSKIPNLSLMKLSAYYKGKGHVVLLNHPGELNFASCVFSQNQKKAIRISQAWAAELSGIGSGQDHPLPPEIETLMPDYSLYGTTYSLGFTSRGCNRNCAFCVVPQKEGRVQSVADIYQFWDRRHSHLRLLDNNFLQSPDWSKRVREIIKEKLTVEFDGLDLRLLTSRVADLLLQLRVEPRWRFAWDYMGAERSVLRGLDLIISRGVAPRKIMVYVLCGFNTEEEQDLYRVQTLAKLGVLPFVQVFNNRRDLPRVRHFARWVNRRYYQFVPWKNYLDRISPS